MKKPCVFGMLFLLLLVVIVSTMGGNDAEREQRHYCDMVRAKYWPDFKGTYSKECAK